jgi:CheY-like chemotaxis protein
MTQLLETILYVEDEPDIRTVASLALHNIGGLEVETCGSGREALARVSQSRPDLILMDVMMPDLDGPTTLSRLREDPGTADIPVIFMTAKAQPEEIEYFKGLGVVDVIGKPFDPLTLADRLRSLWATLDLPGQR